VIKSKLISLCLLAGFVSAMLLISGCAPAPAGGATPSAGGFDWTTIVFIVVIIALFYFVMIRPQNNRRKQQQKLMAELKSGDQVITASGIYGEIDSLDEDTVVIKTESGAKIRMSRQSIAGKRSLQ
jgi:preprotein translocase subunit YajC